MATFVAGSVRGCSRLSKLTGVISSPQKSRKLVTKCCRPISSKLTCMTPQLRVVRDVFPQFQVRRMSENFSSEADFAQLCWSCKADLTSNDDLLVCKKCNVLRSPPDNLNYFELFGIEVTFKMDLKNLAQKYKDMQRVLHPDRFTQASEGEKTLSDTWSPLVNEAYACLKKPIRRANYLLTLSGKPLREGEELGLDANFLAEIVDLNEEIVEAEGQTDVAGLMRHVKEVLQTLYDKVEVAFNDNDIDKARMITAKVRYYENLKKKIVDRETEMGVVR